MSSMMEGFPRSWYQVAWSDEVAPGAVVRLHYFGQELVLFRTESGTASVLRAYCEHFGAHMGYGGTVDGDCIVCPFHAWKWDGAGRNTDIPFSSRTKQARRVPAWTTVETAGMICVWYDPDGQPPAWAPPTVPEADDPAYLPAYPQMVKCYASVPVKPLWPVENLVDQFHFPSVHKAGSPAELLSVTTDGPVLTTTFRAEFGGGKKKTKFTPDGPVAGAIEGAAHGLGFVISTFQGLSPATYIMATTPVEEETSDMRVSVFMPRERALDSGELSAFAQAALREFCKQNERDLVIWGHWEYRENPVLLPEEKACRQLRAWAADFYK
jgi:phenylpropionate dioxygenase-like ring-hydroxylating dioxygenase large terminal subunit